MSTVVTRLPLTTTSRRRVCPGACAAAPRVSPQPVKAMPASAAAVCPSNSRRVVMLSPSSDCHCERSEAIPEDCFVAPLLATTEIGLRGVAAARRAEPQQPLARCRGDAALGDQRGDKTRRRHIEGVICRRAVRRGQPHLDPRAGFRPAGDVGYLARVTLLDRYCAAILDVPINRRRRERDIEWAGVVS